MCDKNKILSDLDSDGFTADVQLCFFFIKGPKKKRKRLFTSKMKKESELALPEMPVCPTVQGGKSNEVNRGKTFN